MCHFVKSDPFWVHACTLPEPKRGPKAKTKVKNMTKSKQQQSALVTRADHPCANTERERERVRERDVFYVYINIFILLLLFVLVCVKTW